MIYRMMLVLVLGAGLAWAEQQVVEAADDAAAEEVLVEAEKVAPEADADKADAETEPAKAKAEPKPKADAKPKAAKAEPQAATETEAEPETDAEPAAAAEAAVVEAVSPAKEDPTPAKPDPAPAPPIVDASPKGQTAPDRFPTPAELVERMKQMQQTHEALLKVAYFDLSERIVEKPPEFSLFADGTGQTLRSLIDRLHQARDDQDVRAALVTLKGSGMNIAQAQEIREALIELRRAGKQTFVYADSYDTISYTIASGATNVCLLEGGEIMIPGIALEAMFAKGLLDRIGIQADYIQIGEYKGADEQLTRVEPSDELRGELNKLIDALYDQIVAGISLNRNLSSETVRQLIDEAIIAAPIAKQRGLVDHLVDIDGLRGLIAEELGDEINLVHDYGKPEREEIDFSNPFAFFSMLARQPAPSDKPAIALIHAEGMIIDGEGGEGLFGSAVGSEDLRQAFRMAVRDDKIKAIVLRVDSPGGSPLASEVIWQAARRAAEEKPVIVSIGSVAASGGYYVASAGDHIFADSVSIVGSIGVVGGKFVVKDLYDKIGLTTESFQRGRNADLFSSSQPFDERQRRMVTNWMRRTYEQFTDRIMATRGGKIGDIDDVARGRVFIARQARELGMVDEIGGLADALAHAADRVGLVAGEYDVRVLPPPKTLADLFLGGADATTPFQPAIKIGGDSMLHALPPLLRRAIGQQVLLLQMLEDRPVVLVSPYVITVR